MSAVSTIVGTERGVAPRVYTCYDVLDVAPSGGVLDFTDGKYVDERNDRAAYLAAQCRQAEYLLDRAACGPGSRLLDIGCGYGRILEHAARRGARAVGISISPFQVAFCRARGLSALELNYRDMFGDPKSVGDCPLSARGLSLFLATRDYLPKNAEREKGTVPLGVSGDCPLFSSQGTTSPRMRNEKRGLSPASSDWDGAFDALIANGSLEHFVQPADAAAGRTDAIYDEMFSIFRRLLTTGGRLVTTAIHFRRVDQVYPRDILRGPFAHPRRSHSYHFAMVLERTFGGWYPAPGQLARCAEPYFRLVDQEDGTHDYHLTSEYWLRRFQWAAATDPRVWWALARKWFRQRRAVVEMLRCQVWDQSWAWQFRPPAPTRLLRQTWLAI